MCIYIYTYHIYIYIYIYTYTYIYTYVDEESLRDGFLYVYNEVSRVWGLN